MRFVSKTSYSLVNKGPDMGQPAYVIMRVAGALASAWQWRHNERDGVSNHQPYDCLLSRLCRHKKTLKLRVTGLCAGNSPVTDEFPVQRASNAENVSIWWRYHEPSFSLPCDHISQLELCCSHVQKRLITPQFLCYLRVGFLTATQLYDLPPDL